MKDDYFYYKCRMEDKQITKPEINKFIKLLNIKLKKFENVQKVILDDKKFPFPNKSDRNLSLMAQEIAIDHLREEIELTQLYKNKIK